MFQIYGIDQAKRIIPASIFAETDQEPGCLVVRELIKNSDIYTQRFSSAALPLGVNTIAMPALAGGFVYCIKSINFIYTAGTITDARFALNHNGAGYLLKCVANLVPFQGLDWSGNIFADEGDFIQASMTVTAIAPAPIIDIVGYRSPYPS